MSHFVEFTRRLLLEGRVRLSQPPRLVAADHALVLDLLTTSYTRALADVAGPTLSFSPAIALRALEFVAWACWYLVHHGEPSSQVEARLVSLPPSADAADHLSADLLFRHLPMVHRRARMLNPNDVLTLQLKETLRNWPLSGVLTDIEEPPTVPVELAGHHGLLLLYAERLVQHQRPSWIVDGPVREYIDLVFAQRQRPLQGVG